jgi:hypothetical protein
MSEKNENRIANLETLRKFLMTSEVPRIEKQPKTFLEISKQPHYENVISNIYAFYFDPHEEHGLGHLFIQSFIECIHEQLDKEKQFLDDFREFVIEVEYGTVDKGRIDLLLYNKKHAIIIENKVSHYLANNLQDYWDTAQREGRKEDNMIGVLLTLTRYRGDLHSHFVNILHVDFLQKVMNNSGPYLMGASDKYITFLKDIYQNFKNMSHKLLSDEDFNFYLQHQHNILDAVKFHEQAKDHIKTQIVDAWNSHNKLRVEPATKNTYQFYSYREIEREGVEDIYFCIWFDKLIMGLKEVWINIFVTGDKFETYFTKTDQKSVIKKTEINNLIRNYASNGIELYSERKEKGDWEYLLGKTYQLNNKQIEKLQNTISGFITNDKFDELIIKLEALF